MRCLKANLYGVVPLHQLNTLKMVCDAGMAVLGD